jgi:DUF309 family protein family protein
MSGETVLDQGRQKAYRPLPEDRRRAALAAFLAAYARGDWFLAHEILEPAWMGTADPTERALHSGLIKLAAAGVHATRGNPAGVVKNLSGARLRLATVTGPNVVRGTGVFASPPASELDLVELVAAIDRHLAMRPGSVAAAPPPIALRP